MEEINEQYSQLSVEDVIKSSDSMNIDDVSHEVSKIFEWEAEYFNNGEYRAQLPDPTRQAIEQEFTNAISQFKQIVDTRTNRADSFFSNKPGFVQTIKNYYKSLYEQFVRDYRGWKMELSQADKLKELNSIFKDAKALQKNIVNLEENIQQRADNTANLATDLGLTELAKFYYQLVEGDRTPRKLNRKANRFRKWLHNRIFGFRKFFMGYNGASRMWLLLALVAFCVAGAFAYQQLFPYVEQLETLDDTTNAFSVYAILIAKSLILVVPIYAIRFCLKNYGSNKHLASDALHKAKSLQTLPTFLSIAKDDPDTIREIATTVSRIVFTPTTSGFIQQKGDYDGSDITINTPTPQIKP